MDYKDILYNYAEYFEQSDVASTVIRWIGWEIIKLLHSICDLCQGLWEAVFQALDFTQVFAMKVGEFYPIWYSLFVVTILAAGTIFLFSEHRPPLLKNLIITMAVVMLLPGGVRLGAQLLQIEQTAFMADGNSVADTTVISNVTDLLYQKNNDWSFESPNCFSGATIKYIDPNEQVEKKTDTVFKYYMVVDEASGEVTYKKIGKGFFGLLTPLYYRYSIHFMAIIGELIVNSLVLIFASYRLFRLIWDMIYGEILAYILSGDVVSGEKTKQVLQYLLNLFWSISIMIWGFAIWREFEIWVASQYSNNFIRILLIAFGGVAMIDGPDIVERVCGIDVGMKDGMMKTMGAMHLMQSGLGAAKKGGELAKTAAGAAKKAGSSMLNPGGKAQQNRMQAATGNGANAQQPPGGVGNPGGSAATAGRKEPPGGAQQPEQSRQAQGSGATSQASGDSSTQTNAQESKPSNAANTSGVDAANTDGFANNSALLETMYDAMGVGLAAPQVGMLKRIVVIDIGEGPIVLINPEILETSGEQTGDEGCLSVPGMAGQVTRPNYVKVKALDEDMNEVEYEWEGLLARAFCHEIDHLDGNMYTELVEGELHQVSYDEDEE